MATLEPKQAKLLTMIGAVDCLIAIAIMIVILLEKSSLPIFIPLLLLISGVMIIVVSMSFHTKK